MPRERVNSSRDGEMSARSEASVSEHEANSRLTAQEAQLGDPAVSQRAVSQSPASQLASVSAAASPEPSLRKNLMRQATSGAVDREVPLQQKQTSSSPKVSEVNRSLEAENARANQAASNAASTASNLAANKPTERTWSGWFSSALSSVGSALDTVGNATIGACKLVADAGVGLAKVAKQVVTDPVGTLESVGKVAVSAVNLATKAVGYIAKGVQSAATWCIEHPDQILPKIGSFLYSAGEMVVSLVGGIVSSVWNGIKAVASGEMTLGQALYNTAVVFCELTGLADVWGAAKHGALALAAYGRGDMMACAQHSGMMAMHGAFAAMSIGSIAATVATGGAAAGSIAAVALGRAGMKQAAKAVLKEGAKQFLKNGAAEIGEVALKEVVQNAPKALASREGGELLLKQVQAQAEKTGASVVELAYRELLRVEGKQGAVQTAKTIVEKGVEGATIEGAQAIAREVGEVRTTTLLKELGLADIIDTHTTRLLTEASETKVKALAKELGERYGLSGREANKMAKEIQSALKSGKADAEIKQILEDGIQKPLTKSLVEGMEQEYKATMRQAARGECKELGEDLSKQLKEAVEYNAKKSGKTLKEYQDELVEATWKGYREGIEAAVKKVVREGIEQAFKRFRSVRPHPHAHHEAGETDPLPRSDLSELDGLGDAKVGLDGGSKRAGEAGRSATQQPEVKTQLVTLADGSVVEIKKIFDDSERLVSTAESVVSGPGAKKGKIDKSDEAPLSLAT